MESNYVHTTDVHNTNAPEAFLPILYDYVQPRSVVDLGCGFGTWLEVFKRFGCQATLGIDGNYIDRQHLVIPDSEFLLHDLTQPLILHRKYDLAICLEVAEHLPANAADTLINTLTMASDTILFSAALPSQGGQNHINEQSFSYWVSRFNEKGFVVKDLFRNRIWDNGNIEWWYRQNIFLVTKSNEMQKSILDYYHPESYLQLVKEAQRINGEVNTLNKDLHDIKQGRLPTKLSIKILIKSMLNLIK